MLVITPFLPARPRLLRLHYALSSEALPRLSINTPGSSSPDLIQPGGAISPSCTDNVEIGLLQLVASHWRQSHRCNACRRRCWPAVRVGYASMSLFQLHFRSAGGSSLSCAVLCTGSSTGSAWISPRSSTPRSSRRRRISVCGGCAPSSSSVLLRTPVRLRGTHCRRSHVLSLSRIDPGLLR